MALDEPKKSDTVYEINGFKYIVDQEFMEKVQPIKIDFTEMGLKPDCKTDLGAEAGCRVCGKEDTC